MNFWLRELAGWALVLVGLAIFGLSIVFLQHPSHPRILEVGPLIVVGFIVFRGGIHLLKVAVAARICLQAAEPVAGKLRPAARRG
jgi:hypothetical protein